jgi:hypothetical protein
LRNFLAQARGDGGAPVQGLSQSAFPDAGEHDQPSKAGIDPSASGTPQASMDAIAGRAAAWLPS